MFYNHAAEKERRRKTDAQLRAREMRGEMAPDHFPSRSATSTEVHRRIPASSHFKPREKTSPAIPQASSTEGSSRSRPELWPPSHSEIIAGLEGENAVHGATIPGWFRGPLLLPSSGDSVSQASSVPGNLALSERPIPTRSRSSDGTKLEPPAIGAVSRGNGGARAPAEAEGIIGVGRALGDIADTGVRASDEEGQGLGLGEGESKLPHPPPRALYSPAEERAIRRVLKKLEAASKDDPSLVRFAEFTTNMWIKLVSEPLIRELERDEAYMASGRQPRRRFAHETGVGTLRRWVSEDARRRHASRSATARRPSSERETKAERYTDTSKGEAGAKSSSGRPRRGVHGIDPASSFAASVKMEAASASTNASTDDSERDLERGGGRWGLSIVGYPVPTGLGSDVVAVSESSADGHGSGEGESSSAVSASEDDSSHRRFEDDYDGGSSHSSSSWNSSWNSSRWGGSSSGHGHGTGGYVVPNRLNIAPSESRLRIHSAIAGGDAKSSAPSDSGRGGKTGDSVGPSDAPREARWSSGTSAIGGGVRKPTPPKRRRRAKAGPAASQRPDVDDDAASSYEVTPAQAAAAEADRLNTLMQARRPPPHQLPRPTVPSLRDHRVEARAQGTLVLERTASITGVTTATASATMISTPTESSSPNSRASSLTPGAKGRKWCLNRGDSSKKIGPRQPSRDSNGTPTSAAGEGAAATAAEGFGSSRGSKETVPAPPPLRSPLESRADKKAGPMRKDVDLAWERGAAAASAAMVAAEKRWATVDWPGSPRKEPSRVRRVLFSFQGSTKSYLRLHLAVWIVATALLVADRLLWNLWPRQSVFSSVGNGLCGEGTCGTDYFCAVDEAAGCLAEGPGSVKADDAIARATGRTIITTTNLILATLCHGTWDWLSQTKCLREFLRGWRDDNAFLRSVGVWTMAVVVVLHVYSVLLPSAVDDFEIAVLEPKGVSWPAQLTPTNVDPRVDVEAEVITLAPDDLASLLWVSVVLTLSALLLARRLCFSCCSWSGGGGGSHGAYALLTGWLKPILSAAVIAESFRRRSHPHVWVLNGPVLLWFVVDILCRRFSRRFDSFVAGARVALGSEHDLLLWDIATACEKPSLSHTSSIPSKIGGIVMMGPTGDVGSGRISRCTATATTATTAAVFSASLSLSLSAVHEVVTVRHEAAGAGESLPDPRPARPKPERPSPSSKVTVAMKNAEEIRGGHGEEDSVHGGAGSRSNSGGSGEWPPAEANVSAEMADASEAGSVAAASESETDESDGTGEDESFSEASLASAVTNSSAASSEEREQTTREEMTWRTSSGARNRAPAMTLTRRSQSAELLGPGGQPLKSLVSSPTSASESTGTGQRLSVESPPEIPRGLWGNPSVENASEEDQDTGLLGRELVPSESRGRGKQGLDIDDDDDDGMSSAGESASDATRSSALGSDGTGTAEEGDMATLFFSREPGRLRQVVLDPLSPSRRATPFLLEEPLPYISGRRLASVPYGQSTGAKPGDGKVLESEDRGGHAGGGEGEPLERFSFARLSAAAFFSSSGRSEGVGKGVAGGSSKRRDSDRLRGGGSDSGGGSVNNPVVKESAREGARRKFDSDSSTSDERPPTSEVRPPTPPVRRRSLRSASSSRSAHSVSAGGSTTRGQVPSASRGNEERGPWTWRPNGSDQDLESNGEKRHEEGEGKREEEAILSTSLQSRERSENPTAMASEAFWKGPEKGETVVMVDASAETSFVEVTIQRRVHAPARARTKVSGARAGSARNDKKNAAMLAKTHETTRRVSTSDYLSFVDSLCRSRIAVPEAHLSRAPRAPITSATTASSRTRPRSYTREPSPTTAGGDPEESPLGDLDSAGEWSCSSSEVVEDPVDLRAETVTAPPETVTWQRLAIVRAPRRVEAARDKDRNSSGRDLPSRLEAGTLGEDPRVEDDVQARAVEVRAMEVDTTGPFPSALGRLASYPELPPLLVVATGAGAGLVIEFLAFAGAAEKVPVRAVTVCYSCDSPSLLRFVTSELLARRVSGIRIVTALLKPGGSGGVDKPEDQQSTADRGSQEMLNGRLNLKDFVKKAPADTEVYFCGELRFDKPLRAACGRMCLAYASARVVENV